MTARQHRQRGLFDPEPETETLERVVRHATVQKSEKVSTTGVHTIEAGKQAENAPSEPSPDHSFADLEAFIAGHR